MTVSWESIANEHILGIAPYEPGKPIGELEREFGRCRAGADPKRHLGIANLAQVVDEGRSRLLGRDARRQPGGRRTGLNQAQLVGDVIVDGVGRRAIVDEVVEREPAGLGRAAKDITNGWPLVCITACAISCAITEASSELSLASATRPRVT